ncbi:MAG: hypothetical protein LBT03_01895 [Holosporales bacterium]|nr:hypothetical protein [Holosporales bacterium]
MNKIAITAVMAATLITASAYARPDVGISLFGGPSFTRIKKGTYSYGWENATDLLVTAEDQRIKPLVHKKTRFHLGSCFELGGQCESVTYGLALEFGTVLGNMKKHSEHSVHLVAVAADTAGTAGDGTAKDAADLPIHTTTNVKTKWYITLLPKIGYNISDSVNTYAGIGILYGSFATESRISWTAPEDNNTKMRTALTDRTSNTFKGKKCRTTGIFEFGLGLKSQVGVFGRLAYRFQLPITIKSSGANDVSLGGTKLYEQSIRLSVGRIF